MVHLQLKPINNKLKEAIIFILENIPNKKTMGMKKLAKLLYFADFNNFKIKHESITNEEYLRWEHGPFPKSLYEVIEDLKLDKILSVTEQKANDKTVKYDFELLNKQPIKDLSEEDKAQLRKTISKLGNLTAKELESLSHKDTPWDVTDQDEVISYKFVFYRDEEFARVVE